MGCPALVLSLVVGACAPADERPVLRDPAAGFEWRAPVGWRVAAEPEAAAAWTSPDGALRATLVVGDAADAATTHDRLVRAIFNARESTVPGELGALPATASTGMTLIGPVTGEARLVTAATGRRAHSVHVWGEAGRMRRDAATVDALIAGFRALD